MARFGSSRRFLFCHKTKLLLLLRGDAISLEPCLLFESGGLLGFDAFPLSFGFFGNAVLFFEPGCLTLLFLFLELLGLESDFFKLKFLFLLFLAKALGFGLRGCNRLSVSLLSSGLGDMLLSLNAQAFGLSFFGSYLSLLLLGSLFLNRLFGVLSIFLIVCSPVPRVPSVVDETKDSESGDDVEYIPQVV